MTQDCAHASERTAIDKEHVNVQKIIPWYLLATPHHSRSTLICGPHPISILLSTPTPIYSQPYLAYVTCHMLTQTSPENWRVLSGPHCEIDVNECASEPCQNGATCVDQVNHYTCTCDSGWAGQYSAVFCLVTYVTEWCLYSPTASLLSASTRVAV